MWETFSYNVQTAKSWEVYLVLNLHILYIAGLVNFIKTHVHAEFGGDHLALWNSMDPTHYSFKLSPHNALVVEIFKSAFCYDILPCKYFAQTKAWSTGKTFRSWYTQVFLPHIQKFLTNFAIDKYMVNGEW